MSISRVELFCDDLKVGKVLRALAGLALQPPKVQPVINAEMRGGEVAAEATNGALLELFRKWLIKKKLSVVVAAHIKRFLSESGLAEGKYGYLLKRAKESGLVRQKGRGIRSSYLVVGAKKRRG
jgi:hypothetical protein